MTSQSETLTPVDRPLLERQLASAAAEVRARSLAMVERAGLGHPGGDLSAADILVTLYQAVLRVDPAYPADPERDRFVMSKGHSSAALYATLAQAGFFSPDRLDTFMAPLSALNGHPRRDALPGIEASTGPLGHGLPLALGMAISAQLDGSNRRVWCLVGDGELQEGTNWEALLLAGQRGLDNLVVIVDRNGLQQGGPTEEIAGLEPLAEKARAFRWSVAEVDGHSHSDLLDCFASVPLEAGAPSFIVANTRKGFGVSFMQDRVEWHHRVPTPAELEAALVELEAQRG